MKKLSSLAIAAFLFAACNTSGSRKVEATAPPASSQSSTPAAQTEGTGADGITSDAPAAVAAPATNNSGTQVMLNPAHGAPGHNCDIPVGAPLTTAAGSAPAAAPNINPAPVMMAPPASSQPGNGNVRLNPAHGAPGHDCTIPVGQPLRG